MADTTTTATPDTDAGHKGANWVRTRPKSDRIGSCGIGSEIGVRGGTEPVGDTLGDGEVGSPSS